MSTTLIVETESPVGGRDLVTVLTEEPEKIVTATQPLLGVIETSDVITNLTMARKVMGDKLNTVTRLLADVKQTRTRAIEREDLMHALSLCETIEKLAGEVDAYSYGCANLLTLANSLGIEEQVTKLIEEDDNAR